MIIVLYLRTCNTNIQALTGVLLVGFHCMHKAKDKKMGCNRKFYGSLEYQDCQKRKINTIKNTQYIGVKIVLGKMKGI